MLEAKAIAVFFTTWCISKIYALINVLWSQRMSTAGTCSEILPLKLLASTGLTVNMLTCHHSGPKH